MLVYEYKSSPRRSSSSGGIIDETGNKLAIHLINDLRIAQILFLESAGGR
jgi:hypothetical protein